MRKKFLLCLRTAAVICILCAVLSGTALAAEELVPMGGAVGIQITVDGVLVAGVSEVETENGTVSPAYGAGIRAGDIIIEVNGSRVSSAAELVKAAELASADGVELTVMRNGKKQICHVIPAQDTGGAPRLGLWLRDGVSGIGTVTYVDPETGAFGALGHGVNDMQTGTLLPVEEGTICRAEIVDIIRGEAGDPGELSGSFYAGEALGSIKANTENGIFGLMDISTEKLGEAIPVADPSEVVSGPATILTCVSGSEIREYEVEISRAGIGGDGRDLMIRVTDPSLLELTGGIVQGMSGSPIIQNGKLVGAVTHVLVSDSTRGYGIFAEHMFQAADAAA